MKEYARELMALAIVGLFAYAMFMNPHDRDLKTAITLALAAAYGFYLGGSKVGSDTAAKNAETVSQVARSDKTQAVEVVNSADSPVPTVSSDG